MAGLLFSQHARVPQQKSTVAILIVWCPYQLLNMQIIPTVCQVRKMGKLNLNLIKFKKTGQLRGKPAFNYKEKWC